MILDKKDEFKNILFDLQNLKKLWWVVLVILSIYILAYHLIFIANFNYADDLYRTYGGYHGWLNWSRYITEALSSVIHAGWYLPDISPIPQIIACIFLSLSSAIVIDILCPEGSITIWKIIASTLMGLSPLFLGCISYKYDSPYMSLSILMSLIPFIFYKRSRIVFGIMSIIGLIAMCMTYQASSGIYPLICIFIASDKLHSGENIKKVISSVLFEASIYVFSLLIFLLFFMRKNGRIKLASSVLEFISSSFKKYVDRYNVIFSNFRPIWLVLVGLIVVAYVTVVVKTSVLPKSRALIISLTTIFLGSILIFGVYLYFDFEANAMAFRSFIGLGVFLSALSLKITDQVGKYYFKLAIAYLAWCFLVFYCVYGNALIEQQRYADFRMQLVYSDLNSLENLYTISGGDETTKVIQVEGDIGLAPVIKNMVKAYPILNSSIPTQFSGGFFGEYYFYHYFGLPEYQQRYDSQGSEIEMIPDLTTLDLPVLKTTMFHQICGDAGHILIKLYPS